ncbi:Gfo/Idh/MocA family oxidoreductase [Nocardiopsis nanhaiensis]
MTHPLRVLVAGAGRAGMVHARNFAAGVPGATLAGVADPDHAARAAAAAELDCPAFARPAEAVADPSVDAVVIAAPTPAHTEIATAALGADRSVLCEKPLARTMDEAHAIAAAEARSSGTVLMGFMRRFDEGFSRAAERVAAGDIGEPVLVRSTTRGPGLPPEWAWDIRRSGGLIAEVNSHDLDTVRHLTGQEFTAVAATGRAAKRPDIAELYPGFVDVVAATFDLSDGGIAQIDGACPAGYGYDARAEVYGTEGTVLVGGPSQRTAVVVRDRVVETDAVRSWRDLFAAAYRAEDTHFVRVARGDEPPLATVTDGLRALEAVMAVNTALGTQHAVPVAGAADRAGT